MKEIETKYIKGNKGKETKRKYELKEHNMYQKYKATKKEQKNPKQNRVYRSER